MKIFLSWSGQTSHCIARELADWLTVIESSLQPFISSHDLAKGSVWFDDLSTALSNTGFGIVVVTPDSVSSSWLHFEAGALFKGLSNTRVVPLLVGLANADINHSPLQMFQTVTPERDQLLDLVRQINNALGHRRTDAQLTKLFDRMWPEIEQVLSDASTRIRNAGVTPEAKKTIVYAPTQWGLTSNARGVSDILSTAKILKVAGGTLKTFVEDSRNIAAVKRIVDGGGSTQLLMMHPEGEGVAILARMRQDYEPRVTEERLKREMELSLERLIDRLGYDVVRTHMRLYRGLPRHGLYVTDQYLIATLYLNGHGASSPSFAVDITATETAAFCNALLNGFEEAWASNLSTAPSRL